MRVEHQTFFYQTFALWACEDWKKLPQIGDVAIWWIGAGSSLTSENERFAALRIHCRWDILVVSTTFVKSQSAGAGVVALRQPVASAARRPVLCSGGSCCRLLKLGGWHCSPLGVTVAWEGCSLRERHSSCRSALKADTASRELWQWQAPLCHARPIDSTGKYLSAFALAFACAHVRARVCVCVCDCVVETDHNDRRLRRSSWLSSDINPFHTTHADQPSYMTGPSVNSLSPKLDHLL